MAALSLLDLPHSVLLAVPWAASDRCAIVLTCRSLHDLFTPDLYKTFKDDVSVGCGPAYWTRSLGFLRTLRDSALLASYVRKLSLQVPSFGLHDLHHGNFQLVASKFTLSSEFNIIALPERVCSQTGPGTANDEAEDLHSDYDSDAGGYHDGPELIVDFVHAILSKLPQLRYLEVDYSDHLQLFDRTPYFRHLIEVKIGISSIGSHTGDTKFDDALRLLSSPRLRKWSLSCSAVEQSSVRCIPPGSSGVEHMKICCPNIRTEDLDYLVSIPRSLKRFQWTGRAWTCHRTDDDEGPCQTSSIVSTLSSLRRARKCLEQVTIDYAFVGTCSHADSGCGSFHDFERLQTLRISPQVLRGFHQCSSSETCSTECSKLRKPNDIARCLPPHVRKLGLSMQVDGCVLANMIFQAAVSDNVPRLNQVVLHSALHCYDSPPHGDDGARLHIPMTTKKYDELVEEIKAAGVALECCCYQTCFQDIVKTDRCLEFLTDLPPDIVIDEAALRESQRVMQGRGIRSLIRQLDWIQRKPISMMQA